jgi:hypothetical protein
MNLGKSIASVLAASLLVPALVVGAASAASDPSTSPPTTTTTTVPTTTAVPTTSAPTTTTTTAVATPAPSPDDVAAALASAGITVVESVDGVSTGIAVTTAQRDAMVDEVIGGAGIFGSDLDEVTPMPEGAPPFSFLVAAWLHDAPTDTAQRAQAWYPSDTDWTRAPDIAFPRAVLLLFAVDVARDVDSNVAPLPPEQTFVVPAVGATSPDASVAGLRPAGAGAIGAACGLISGFFTNQITQLFNMLRLRPDFAGGGVIGFLGGIVATIWNTAIDLAGSVVQGLVRNLGQPVLEAIGKAIAVAGLLSHVSTYLSGWNLQLDAKPDNLPFAVGDAPDQAGVFEVSEASGYRPWQPDLVQCATAFGIELPQVLQPGSEVQWQVVTNAGIDGRAPMIVEQSHDATVPAAGRPRYRFVTGREESADGDLLLGESTVAVRVGNAELKRVLDLAEQLVNQTVAGIVKFALPVPALAAQVQPAVQQLVQKMLDQLHAAITNGTRSVFEQYAQDQVIVYYHKPPEDTTIPSTTAAGDGNRDAFCAAVRAFPGAQASSSSGALTNIASMGAQGLGFVATVEPITPAEMVDEVAALKAMYTAADAVDFAGIGANADAFGAAWLSIFDYCGIAAPS